MTTRRLISTEIWEPRGFETYLEEMEASGLRLAKAGGWLLYFDRAQPRQMRYRVEYIRHPSEEQLALYADCGWEHVAQTNREVQIFRASVDAGIPELHTERETEQAMYRHISRAAMRNALWTLFLVALFAAFLVELGLDAFYLPGSAWRMCIICLLMAYCMGSGLHRFWVTRRYLRRLKQNMRGPADSRSYRRGMWAQVFAAAMLLCYLGVVLEPSIKSIWELAHLTDAPPLSAMTEELDAAGLPYFTPEDLTLQDTQMFAAGDSGVFSHQPLTQAQYTLNCGSWERQTGDSYTMDTFDLRWYRLRWPLTGRWLAGEWNRTWKLEQADRAGFDRLYRARDTDTGRLRLIGQRTRQVAVLDYKGPEPARAEQLFYETFGQEG